MPYQYEGREIELDPTIGIMEGRELGERDDDWWYQGHPCVNYQNNTHQMGLKCEGYESHSGMCGCCRAHLTNYVKENIEVLDDLREIVREGNRHFDFKQSV